MSTKLAVSPETPVRVSGERGFYRPELDCLRFMAFLSVFVFHPFPPQASFYSTATFPGDG